MSQVFVYLNNNAIVIDKIMLISDIYQQDKKYCFHILLPDKVTVEYTNWSKDIVEKQRLEIITFINKARENRR